jgi:hypothetical protein
MQGLSLFCFWSLSGPLTVGGLEFEMCAIHFLDCGETSGYWLCIRKLHRLLIRFQMEHLPVAIATPNYFNTLR